MTENKLRLSFTSRVEDQCAERICYMIEIQYANIFYLFLIIIVPTKEKHTILFLRFGTILLVHFQTHALSHSN